MDALTTHHLLPLVAATLAALALICAIIAIVFAFKARSSAQAAQMSAQTAVQNGNFHTRTRMELQHFSDRVNRLDRELQELSKAVRTSRSRTASVTSAPSTQPTGAAGTPSDTLPAAAAQSRTPPRFFLAGMQKRAWSASEILAPGAAAQAQFEVTPKSPTEGEIRLAVSNERLRSLQSRPQDYPSVVFEIAVERQGGRLRERRPGRVVADGHGGWRLDRPIELVIQ